MDSLSMSAKPKPIPLPPTPIPRLLGNPNGRNSTSIIRRRSRRKVLNALAALIVVIIVILIVGVSVLSAAVKVLPEYQRGVVFRLGRITGIRRPGLILLIPIIDKMRRIDL